MCIMSSQNPNKNKIFKFDDGSKVWFTSDTHFGHENIMRFSNRPFETVEDMNQTIIDNWNSKVGHDDYVFHLGDFAFANMGYWKKVLSQLNGHKILVKGNHDEKPLKGWDKFDEFELITYQLKINIEGRQIYLNHFPFNCYAGSYRGDNAIWQLYGHIHSTHNGCNGKDFIRLNALFPYQYDIGTDNNDFYPINYNEIKEIINKRIEDFNNIQLKIEESKNLISKIFDNVKQYDISFDDFLKYSITACMHDSEQLKQIWGN